MHSAKLRRSHAAWFIVGTLAVGGPPSPTTAGVLTGNCVVGERPAATLLFPYFEVDLADPQGVTTLVSINAMPRINELGFALTTLARVTVWSEWGIPTFTFSLYLKSADVQTLNLRDLFTTGVAPVTGPPGFPSSFPGCNPTFAGNSIDPTILRLAHTGQKVLGSCFSGGSLGPQVATGYLTVDTAVRCPAGNGGGGASPADGASYFSGASKIADNANQLWGDWFRVTPGDDFASGNAAVALQADADAFAAGDYTFYGRYLGFSGADRRRPLPSNYNARFLQGGGFDAGTQLIIWRDTRSDDASPISCAGAATCASASCRPEWLPLGEQRVVARDEDSHSTSFNASEFFDLATQRIGVSTIPQPYGFGWLLLDLDQTKFGGQPAQAWVGVEASAEGRYSVGFPAIPTNDLCAVTP